MRRGGISEIKHEERTEPDYYNDDDYDNHYYDNYHYGNDDYYEDYDIDNDSDFWRRAADD